MPSARAISFTSLATMVNSSGAVVIPKGKAVVGSVAFIKVKIFETVGVLVCENLHL